MSGTVIQGNPGIGETVSGVALAASDNFSARYDLDLVQGVFSREAHSLCGESYVDRILILNTAKGGVATAWMLLEMVRRGKAPKALLLNTTNPIMAQGAALADLPFVTGFDRDITTAIRTGQTVTVEPATGRVTIDEG
jgi:uncharacterized protein